MAYPAYCAESESSARLKPYRPENRASGNLQVSVCQPGPGTDRHDPVLRWPAQSSDASAPAASYLRLKPGEPFIRRTTAVTSTGPGCHEGNCWSTATCREDPAGRAAARPRMVDGAPTPSTYTPSDPAAADHRALVRGSAPPPTRSPPPPPAAAAPRALVGGGARCFCGGGAGDSRARRSAGDPMVMIVGVDVSATFVAVVVREPVTARTAAGAWKGRDA